MRWNEWNFPQKKWRFFRWANHRTRSNSWPERSREYGWWSQGPEQVTDVLIFIINMFVDVIHVSFSEYIYIYILIYICWVIFKNRSMVIHHEKISWKSTGDVFLLTIQAKKVNILTQCHLKDVVFGRCSMCKAAKRPLTATRFAVASFRSLEQLRLVSAGPPDGWDGRSGCRR